MVTTKDLPLQIRPRDAPAFRNTMEGFKFPSTGTQPEVTVHGGWGGGKRGGDGPFMSVQGLNYMEFYKALLSQINSSLPLLPPTRSVKQKANTKECGVQVNAKVDAGVQCSLGPKTLHENHPRTFSGGEDDPVAPTPPLYRGKPLTLLRTPVNGLRFTRPLSVYSPLFDRRILLKSVKPPHHDDEEEEEEEEEEEDDETTDDHSQDEEHDQSVDPSPDMGIENEASLTEGNNKPLHRAFKKFNFQFLEQKYGFFHCKECNIRWESAYVWCISGTSKVYYKQFCRKCQVGFNPYKVESLICKECSQTSCCCDKKQRHTNARRPHRQDLCGRCKGTRLSCDATYSFKYIV